MLLETGLVMLLETGLEMLLQTGLEMLLEQWVSVCGLGTFQGSMI